MNGPMRSPRLIVRALDDETLVYDLARDRAHRLDPLASLVFSLADGTRTAGEIAAGVEARFPTGSPELVVEYTLDRLEAAHLVEPVRRASPRARMSRRRLLALIGSGAAQLPVVTSLVAPTALQAASYLTPMQCAARPRNACDVQPRKCSGSPYTSCQKVSNVCRCR